MFNSLHLKFTLKCKSYPMFIIMFLFFFILFFIFRQREREGKRLHCIVASCARPLLGTWPRHVPWSGIEPRTVWFTGQHSIHWATPARPVIMFLKEMGNSDGLTLGLMELDWKLWFILELLERVSGWCEKLD